MGNRRTYDALLAAADSDPAARERVLRFANEVGWAPDDPAWDSAAVAVLMGPAHRIEDLPDRAAEAVRNALTAMLPEIDAQVKATAESGMTFALEKMSDTLVSRVGQFEAQLTSVVDAANGRLSRLHATNAAGVWLQNRAPGIWLTFAFVVGVVVCGLIWSGRDYRWGYDAGASAQRRADVSLARTAPARWAQIVHGR